MSAIKHVEQKTFGDFLATYRRFSIPAFQRPYSWLPKNITTLWESIVSSTQNYYIGTLVVIPTADNSGMEIIDGQQRITTLLLFFIALRDILAKDSKFLLSKEKIVGAEKYLWDTEDFGPSKEVRLRFNKRNLRNIFEKLINGEELPHADDLDDNQRRLIKNYGVLKKQIKEYFKTQEDREKAFTELTSKVQTLEFIIIICNSDSDAFQLFEGLNSTGLDLSVVDLLKNAVLKAIDEKSQRSTEFLTQAEEVWSEMESMFEERDIKHFSRFIRHQWIARRGYISNSKLFDEIKSKELSKASTAKDVIKYIKDLRDDAQVYLAIRHAEALKKVEKKLSRKAYVTQLKERLELFRALNVEQAYEVLLALFRKFISTETYTPSQFLGNIESLWKFAFKTRFLSISPASYESLFADFCREISEYSGKDLNEKTQVFFKKLSSLVDGPEQESEFVDSFANDLKYSNKDYPLIRYILEQIYLERNPSIKINDPSLDHFIPQNQEEWGITDSVDGYIHKIGNLALLNTKLNLQLQNAGLEKKINDVYAVSEFLENSDTLVRLKKEFEDNPEGAVIKRGEYLGRKAFEILRVK